MFTIPDADHCVYHPLSQWMCLPTLVLIIGFFFFNPDPNHCIYHPWGWPLCLPSPELFIVFTIPSTFHCFFLIIVGADHFLYHPWYWSLCLPSQMYLIVFTMIHAYYLVVKPWRQSMSLPSLTLIISCIIPEAECVYHPCRSLFCLSSLTLLIVFTTLGADQKANAADLKTTIFVAILILILSGFCNYIKGQGRANLPYPL